MKETLGLIPQVFYDLIGRIVPGAAILAAAVLLFGDPARTRTHALTVAQLPGFTLTLGFVAALLVAYLTGVLLGALGFAWFEDRKHRTKKFDDLPQEVPAGRLRLDDLPYVYDLILIRNPAAGTRLVKLRAESHLCRVLIVGCILLGALYAIARRTTMTPAVWLVLAALTLTAFAAYAFQRHLQVRAWLLQINCWKILQSEPAEPPQQASPSLVNPTPEPTVTASQLST